MPEGCSDCHPIISSAVATDFIINKQSTVLWNATNTCTSLWLWRLFDCFHGRPRQATDVLQPSWLIVPPALDFQTLTTRCPRVYRRVPHSSGGSWNLWAGEWGPVILPKCRLPRYILGIFFTCGKSATWDPRLYFPSEGRRAEDFSILKNPTASAGFEPANLGTRGQHANP
jgi:hypothetical protein